MTRDRGEPQRAPCRPPLRPTLEVCLQGIDSVLAAEEGGADRIELCEHLAVGGVTPSAGIIAVACQRLSIPVHVLIRPREGDFLYNEAELAVIERDIATARSLGASGVVLGFLRSDGTIDRPQTARMIAIARPMSVTFHKAFDETVDPGQALEDLAALGVDRVLTSGQAPTAREGRAQLAALSGQAAGRVIVMAGGRITEHDLPALVEAGLDEIHVGSAARTGGRTDPARVRRLREAARAARP